ncbi:hypothetical protein BH09PSE5_BH09PSE5_12690 [soil metagenome]
MTNFAVKPIAALARSLVLSLFIGAASVAHAQGKPAVFKPAQISESGLIDALEIDTPANDSLGQTRGFTPAATPRRATANTGKAALQVTFITDSAELSAETRSVLDTVAKALVSDRLAGFTFKVEGHADPRGGAEHNLKLSQERAEAVVNYLVEKHGVIAERLSPLGKGATELLDPRNPQAPQNRRVTLVTNRG